MLVRDIIDGEVESLDSAVDISYVSLREDGTYEDATTMNASVFIDEDQVSKLGDGSIADYIRSAFGTCVGIIHKRVIPVKPPKGKSVMFVLGG